MKKLSAIILAVLLLSSCAGGAGGEEVSDISETTSVTTTTETETEAETEATTIETEPNNVECVNEESQKLYDILTDNIGEWERENMSSGTLIDVDFDGTPEFILGYMDEDNYCFELFKLNNGEVVKFTEFTENDYSAIIALYTDENGKKSWVIPYYKHLSEDSMEHTISLFDFMGNEVTEYVKFSERMFFKTGSDGTYNKTEYILYMDEKEFVITDEQLNSYDEIKAIWNYPDTFPEDPTEAYWTLYIHQFYDIITPTTYSIFHWEDAYEPTWSEIDSEELNKKLIRLSNAYVTNDEEYMMYGYPLYAAIAKPVIYLYPEETMDVDVQVVFPDGGSFTCTYPDYGNGWSVTANPDGTLINKADGLEYSYLYWEGKGAIKWDFSRGFVVKGSDTAAFLQEKLAYLGLKPREYNEFIVYWLPLMQGNEYNLITFQTTAYEESAVLNVLPKPDSVLRVFMAYMPLENSISIPEQQLKTFERTGFSVIEWGGTCVD